MNKRKMHIVINEQTADLTNNTDKLNATIKRLPKGMKSSSNYTRYRIMFYFQNPNHVTDKTVAQEKYFSIVAMANSGHISLLHHTMKVYRILPDSFTPGDMDVDLYDTDDAGSYMHHAFDMLKGFFVSKAYKQSAWHMSARYLKLINRKKQLEAQIKAVDDKMEQDKVVTTI